MRVNIVIIKIILLLIFVLGGCKREVNEDICSFKNISLGEPISSLKKKFRVIYDSSIKAYVLYIPSDSMFRSDVVVHYEKRGFFKKKVVKKVFWVFNSWVTFEDALQFCTKEFGDYVKVTDKVFEFRKERCIFSLANFRAKDEPKRALSLSMRCFEKDAFVNKRIESD